MWCVKYYEDTEKKRQAAENIFHDKKESIKQHKKEMCVENRTSNIIQQKAKYQETWSWSATDM